MTFDLSKEIIIRQENYVKIKFNTKISNPDNCNLVVVQNGITRRVNRIDDNIINPLRLSIFNRNKIDDNEYTVYKVKSNYFDATWGGNVQYIDKRLNNIQEKVFIRASYSFRIYAAEKVISLLSDSLDKYDVKYMNIKVNSKIDNAIKSCIVKKLNELGFIKTQNDIYNLAREVETLINETILPLFGIELINLNFELEESDDHYSFRKEYEWNKIKKNGDENGNI